MILSAIVIFALVAVSSAQYKYYDNKWDWDNKWDTVKLYKSDYRTHLWGYPLRKDYIYYKDYDKDYLYKDLDEGWRRHDVEMKYYEPYRYVHPMVKDLRDDKYEVKYVRPYIKEEVKLIDPKYKEEIKYYNPMKEEVKLIRPVTYLDYKKDWDKEWEPKDWEHREVKALEWDKRYSAYEIKTPEMYQWNERSEHKPALVKAIEPVKRLEVKVDPIHYVKDDLKVIV